MSAIDPLDPTFQPLSDLIRRLPRRPSPPTVCRWCLRGVGGVKLRTLKIAGVRYTTEREFRDFLTAIGTDPAEKPSGDREAVSRQLAAAGYA